MPKKDTKRAPEDVVRVLRVIEYIGPRSWVEKTLSNSLKGTFEPAMGKRICAVTVGDYPEMLVKAGEFAMPENGMSPWNRIDKPEKYPADEPRLPFVVAVPAP